jgi:nucleotide-binding universal stress UspA family protein
MRGLLVATDLSARADRAVERAVVLCSRLQLMLTVLHVVDDTLPATIHARRVEEAQSAIRDHIAALPDARELTLNVVVVAGRPFLEIIAAADARDADLVVLGMHREEPFADMFRGTTTERIIRHGMRPVLVVRERAGHDYRRIVVAVDFSVHSQHALDFALNNLPRPEQLVLVHAFHVPFGGFLTGDKVRAEVAGRHTEMLRGMVAEALGRLLPDCPPPPVVHRVVREGETTEVIFGEVQEREADLLVLGTHGRTGVAHALLGSVAERVLDSAPCDVLTVRAW